MAGQTKDYNDRLEEFTEERFREDYNTCKYSSILFLDTRRWLFDTFLSFQRVSFKSIGLAQSDKY